MNERFYCTNCQNMAVLNTNARCAKCGSDSVVSEHALVNALKNTVDKSTKPSVGMSVRNATGEASSPIRVANSSRGEAAKRSFTDENIRRFLRAQGLHDVFMWWDGSFWEWIKPLDANELDTFLSSQNTPFPCTLETCLVLNNKDFKERVVVITWAFARTKVEVQEPEPVAESEISPDES